MLQDSPFLNALQDGLLNLPGKEAQYRMAPSLRKQELLHNWPIKDARQSAVLILLYPDAAEQDRWKTVLMKRNEYPGAHSGQISFPGGRYEKEDDNYRMTALRETEEEIGVSQQEIETIGKLSEIYVPASHFMIHPFVGYLRRRPAFTPDPTEVAELLEIPLRKLFHEETKSETEILLKSGNKLTAPYYNVHGEVVWGATAMIISELEVIVSGLQT